MYTPASFVLQTDAECHAVIREHNFGTLVSVDAAGEPEVSHLPFLLVRDRGPHGTLIAHLAAANPQVARLSVGRPVLAVFGGPHAYVSPGWYEVQPAVPTWNYVAVHAQGIPRRVDSPAQVERWLAAQVDESEADFGTGWQMSSLPAEYREAMLRGIVCFELPIDRLEGKAKLSQNRGRPDRLRVQSALARAGDPSARAVAQLMAALAAEESTKAE